MNLNSRFKYPPPIARTLGVELVDSGERTATIEIVTDLAKHGNPISTGQSRIKRYQGVNRFGAWK